MKILVTGSSGYIGQSLVKLLREKGNEVIDFDIQNYHQNLKIKRDIELCFELNKNIDLVIHLAALAGVEKDISEYQDYLNNNVQGTFNLLEAMREFGVKKLIFASSCSVYGNNHICEESDELYPESFYGLSKVMGEKLVHFYGSKFNINYQILRIFNVIGNGINSDFQKNRLIPKILESLKTNKPANIYAQKNIDLPQTRDYVDIKNVIDVIYRLLLDPPKNGILNIGSGEEHSALNIFSYCSELLNKDFKTNFIKGRDGDCDYQTADVAKLKSLNLFQKTDIKKVIKDIIEHDK